MPSLAQLANTSLYGPNNPIGQPGPQPTTISGYVGYTGGTGPDGDNPMGSGEWALGSNFAFGNVRPLQGAPATVRRSLFRAGKYGLSSYGPIAGATTPNFGFAGTGIYMDPFANGGTFGTGPNAVNQLASVQGTYTYPYIAPMIP
jgi:hypothetical protein